ncbi:hypothetical protein [Curtobacterium sp. MCBA15_001]|uniref:hypothetical protein n=1 Tax=Curtobacterium sp. MCBA15_001 TaxID=1898731 RepID=UPI0008DE43F5|nr:hypothetical protein [Curtobacterium sp. MCBA15_001]OIH93736.1 hypothetical protein BIU90_08880 [Curtobacterium sp. MCBA15_001]
MGRRNYLVEGVSGTGKTAVCHELRRRGLHAVNGDRELAYQGDPVTGRAVSAVAGTAVHDHHLWDVERVRAIAGDASQPATFFCGGSRNAEGFLEVFDAVFVLVVDAATLERRLDARGDDEWAGAGRTDERALVRRLHASGAGTPDGVRLDATQPLELVVDELLRRCAVFDDGSERSVWWVSEDGADEDPRFLGAFSTWAAAAASADDRRRQVHESRTVYVDRYTVGETAWASGFFQVDA